MLDPLVKLYRALGKPEINNNYFSAEVIYNSQIRETIANFRQNYTSLGRFEEISVDGKDVTEVEIPDHGSRINVAVKVVTGSSSKFYPTISELISKNPCINNGSCPQEFYLIDNDYYTNDKTIAPCMTSLNKFCCFVKHLSHLAQYHDNKDSTNKGINLVFIHPDDSGVQNTAVLNIKATANIVEKCLNLDLTLLNELCNNNQPTGMHHQEKINIFSSTIIDFIDNKGTKLNELISNWGEFLDSYNKNVQTYMSGFAFHKAKREVAEAEIAISDQISKVLSDITTRVLSIPLSFAAIAALIKTNGFWEGYFIVIGIFFASLIISQLIANQQKQFTRVCKSNKLIMSSFDGRRETYPKDLKDHIDSLEKDFERHQSRVRRTLLTFRALSWAPIIFALIALKFMIDSQP